MTRRERLERKIEKREEWAAGRREKSAALREIGKEYRHDWAFITQPGHIPARAAMNRRDDKAHEHDAMAAHHDSKAAGLAAQLDRSVFSDDADAVEQLEARIAEHEATRDRMKLVNKLYAKGDAAGLAAIGLDLDALKAKLAAAAGPYWGSKPHLPYELTNLGARIRADRERIEDIRRRKARAEQAESAGGVLIETQPDWQGWCRVTFAEKPDREVLDALKAAGYRWGSGHWAGEYEKLPEVLKK
jgi:hypothetical protein